MLFLLNDVVLKLDAKSLTPPIQGRRFSALSLAFVRELGAEMFAQTPLLHLEEPERARRLASLIVAKSPRINAALFLAPEPDCAPEQVAIRFASVSFEVMGMLYLSQQNGRLTTLAADKQVWRRLAA